MPDETRDATIARLRRQAVRDRATILRLRLALVDEVARLWPRPASLVARASVLAAWLAGGRPGVDAMRRCQLAALAVSEDDDHA